MPDEHATSSTSRQMDLVKLRVYAEETIEAFGKDEPCGVPGWVVLWLLDHQEITR